MHQANGSTWLTSAGLVVDNGMSTQRDRGFYGALREAVEAVIWAW